MGVANTTKRRIRVLVADPEAIFRIGLKKVFGVEDDLRVVAQADKAAQVPGLAKKFKPNLLFVQAEMLGRDPRDFIFAHPPGLGAWQDHHHCLGAGR